MEYLLVKTIHHLIIKFEIILLEMEIVRDTTSFTSKCLQTDMAYRHISP